MNLFKSTYDVIDTTTWKRKLHYSLFLDAVQPHFNVCLELDITSFLGVVKANKWSFTLAFIHTITACANKLENFRYRFLDDQVVLYHTIHTSFTYLDAETELFKVINVPMEDSIEAFIENGQHIINNQTDYITGPIANDVYQYSSLPWISFTHFTHTIGTNNRKANPMFDWGKYVEKNGRIVIPFAVQVHHSFVDGYHVGQFIELLQKRLNEF